MYHDNKRLALRILLVVLGAVLVCLSIAEVLDSSLYAGMGGALMGIEVLQILRTIKYRSDPHYQRKIDTEASDERNDFLRMKSWYLTGIIVVIVEGVGSIIAMVLGKSDLQQMLSYSVCLILVVYWISFVVLSRRY